MLIYTITDVLPAVQGRSDFVVSRRDGYIVVDYLYRQDDSFDDPIRTECRGIKFFLDGELMARPFHKFFNVGETPGTQIDLLPFTEPHIITEKMDGTMVHPGFDGDGRLRLMTRMGLTEHARNAEKHCDQRILDWCYEMLRDGFTPIMEFTGPSNRIVVYYPEHALTLLAVRHNTTGDYIDLGLVKAPKCLPRVQQLEINGDTLLETIKPSMDREGVVVQWSDGWMVKIKTDDYIAKHKAVSSTALEKNVLDLIVTNGLDDVVPLLSTDERKRVERYADEVNYGIDGTAAVVGRFVRDRMHLSQKDFAADAQRLCKPLRSIVFDVRNHNRIPREAVREAIARNTATEARVDSIRELFNARYV